MSMSILRLMSTCYSLETFSYLSMLMSMFMFVIFFEFINVDLCLFPRFVSILFMVILGSIFLYVLNYLSLPDLLCTSCNMILLCSITGHLILLSTFT